MSGSAEHSLLKNFFEKYILKAHKVFFFFLNTVSQVKWSHSIFNVAYKYNLLLVLKILSYSLYNNLTDEMQAVARNIMSARNRQATFSLYTILIMKLKNN